MSLIYGMINRSFATRKVYVRKMNLDDSGTARRFAVVDNEMRRFSMRFIWMDSESFNID
jgi:hypothetical protein